jgi:hypothetical protein
MEFHVGDSGALATAFASLELESFERLSQGSVDFSLHVYTCVWDGRR